MASNQDSRHLERREPLISPIRLTPHERTRLALVGVAGLTLYWLLTTSFDALGSFIFALASAYLMLPLVDLLDRRLPGYIYRRFAEDYSHHKAEASMPSRHDEETPQGKEHTARR